MCYNLSKEYLLFEFDKGIIMASDEKIYKTIQWILKRMHDPRTGMHGIENMFDSDLRHSLTQDEKILFQSYILEQIEKNEALGDKAKNVNEFLADLKTDVIDKLTKVRNHEFSPKSLQSIMDKFNELKFHFSGKNVMKYHISTSCGNAAKAFTYLNSVIPAYNEKLLKEGHSSDELLEPLDLKIIHTTDPEHIIDGQVGHTVPCVKMSDGKYRALDPQLALWHLDVKDEKNWGPEHKFGFHFLDGNIIDGGSVRHLINSFHNKEFPIVRILTVAEHDKCVSHTEFRNMTTKRDKKQNSFVRVWTWF